MMVYADEKQVRCTVIGRFAIAIMALMFVKTCESKCGYDAIFNFGDSNSDTGEYFTAFPPLVSPNGMTFFKKPSGRVSDGRLTIDFIAEAFEFPYLSPYLQSTGSDFRNGANFASFLASALSETTLSVSGFSPFSLDVQLDQLKDFKLKLQTYQGKRGTDKVPRADVFNKSIYTFYIGQNDFTASLLTTGVIGARTNLPQIVSQITATINEIYKLGGRTFTVQNLAPIGCFPTFLTILPHEFTDIDEFGCMISYNNLVVEYNNMLKQGLQTTRQQLSNAQVVYVDTHSVLLTLFRNPNSYGLNYTVTACCGYGGGAYNFDPRVFCGARALIDDEIVEAKACSDPFNYIVWDGIHMTEATNKIVAQAIISGAYFDPPFILDSKCNRKNDQK